MVGETREHIPQVALRVEPVPSAVFCTGNFYSSIRVLLESLGQLGITHRRTAYHHPVDDSYIERFHRRWKEERVWTKEYCSLEEAPTSIARWIEGYNHDGLVESKIAPLAKPSWLLQF